MNLEQHVQDHLRGWLPSKSRILCAVSGGPDSVALAHLLKGSPYIVTLGHVDHQMRKGSAGDARFVQDLAQKWEIPFEMTRVRVRRHNEEEARNQRYQALLKMAEKGRCSAIVTAHTADDQSETVLMNFLRGAGPSGLAGIPPVRALNKKVRLLRPLLTSPRTDIMDYLKKHRLASCQDPTNSSPRFTRNRIRHQLLPLLEREYPGLKNRLIGMGDIFREEQSLWAGQIQREINKTVRRDKQKITVDLPRLLGYHRALGRRILRHLLTGISFQDTERVFQLASSPNGNPSLQLSGGLQVKRSHHKLVISARGLHE